MSRYQALIFDLGNVIFNFSFDNIFYYWAKVTGIHANELKQKFDIDETYYKFEKGEIDSLTFREYVSEKLGFCMTDVEFDNGWNAIYLNVVPGIEQILRGLKFNFRLIVLTNTTEIHARRWKIKYASILRYFENVFCSHEIKARKPDRNAFGTVLNYLKLNPNDVVFLDDNPEFVKAASEMGITSILVRSPDQMIRELNKLGIYVD